jgi:hypothetical protein
MGLKQSFGETPFSVARHYITINNLGTIFPLFITLSNILLNEEINNNHMKILNGIRITHQKCKEN